MGTSSPGLSVPRDPPVWCEAETGFAANITPELPAERVASVSTDGGGPLSPLAHGWWERSGRYGGNKSGTAEVCSSPLSLNRDKGDFFTGEKLLPARTGVTDCHNQSADWSRNDSF